MLDKKRITPEMAASICALWNASQNGQKAVAKAGVEFGTDNPPSIRFYIENGKLSVEPDLSVFM